MSNPLPEKRVGLALLLIGGFSFITYIFYSYAKKESDPATFLFFLGLLLLGWYLRQQFKNWGAPPPPPRPPPKPAAPSPPKPAGPAPKKGGLSLPFGKKPAPPPPPPPPKPAAPPPPPKPKGLIGVLDNFFKPKNRK